MEIVKVEGGFYLTHEGLSYGGYCEDQSKVSSPYISWMFRKPPQAGTVLHLGLGTGEIPRQLARLFPGLVQTVIENDPRVLELASQFFLPTELEVIEADAYSFVNECSRDQRCFDYVFWDIFGPLPSEFCYRLKDITNIQLRANIYGPDNVQAIDIKRLSRAFGNAKIYDCKPNVVMFCDKERVDSANAV